MADKYFPMNGSPTASVRQGKLGLEEVEDYRLGGYHPVQIGDIFDDRYRVERKLGHGMDSTIWLVRDKELNRCAPLKILTANTFQYREYAELEILSDTSSRAAECGRSRGGYCPHIG
jgi:hypothetical protein